MELLAVIVGLEILKIENSQVIIYSDSKYVVDAVEKGWIWNWVKIRFKGKKKPGSLDALFENIPETSGKICLGKGSCQHS